jgi:hypothetical protein
MEMLVSISILIVISGIVMTAMSQMLKNQGTVMNRSETHANVRAATEFLQQEIGQAGRVALPGAVTLTAAVSAGSNSVAVTSVNSMFVGEQLLIDGGGSQETVTVTAINVGSSTITAAFSNAHASGAIVQAHGAFASGIVPTTTNGSTASVLKLYGDINDDGNLYYVEYTCDTTNGFLYRNAINMTTNLPAGTSPAKPSNGAGNVLLNNVQPNPASAACFVYLQQMVGGNTYVTNVAITLTVQTQLKDPTTNQYQLETKALLNVSPRNIFDVWELASAGAGTSPRIQPMPVTVTGLLP